MSDPTIGTVSDARPQEPGISPTYDTRAEQMFFRFSDEELARLERFGKRCSFAAGDLLARTGEAGHGLVADPSAARSRCDARSAPAIVSSSSTSAAAS